MALLKATELLELIHDLSMDQAAEVLMFLDGKPFSLKDYGIWRLPYQLQPKEKLYKTGRQVAKTVTICQESILHCSLHPFFRVMYLTPSEKQTARFSREKLGPCLRYSPIICKELASRGDVRNVYTKSFANGSSMELSYIGDSADRIRGATVDEVLIDETQDIKYGELPVVYECLQASKHKWKRFAGTPKDMANTLELLWDKSSKHEWVIECEHCHRYNIPDEETIWKMVGKEGPICVGCEELLNVRRGAWCGMNPEWDKVMVGFHIPQIVIPANVEGEDSFGRKNWYTLLDKRDKHGYSDSRFANEVLGISHDLGGRLITLTELRACCRLGSMEELAREARSGRYEYICAGVDWGVAAEKSFTVLCIAGIQADGIIHVLFAKKYRSVDTFVQCEDIAGLFRKYNCFRLSGDAGMGAANHMHLRHIIGVERILEMMYMPVISRSIMRWDGKAMSGFGRYNVDRTSSLNLLFFDLKRQSILLPEYEEAAPYIQDILSVYEEELPSGRKRFTHPADIPDDFAHALNFCTLALRRVAGMPIVDLALPDFSEM